ncbi:CoA transferase [Nocardioides sp. TRM66260-LWL]|uniref:CaiB/BaiF CoA-transferase family protein n=1 Tax=Nocardioides sp. TRM66260-LWL TaxID=2874478 RepID=UPI001CC43BBF|nr:CoA transferase [Nocardioides sp. TRM66260-LWL]MBZ5735330.1 CoA transferase [Nocardioides sp. TRM66260-LWL]
MSNAPAPPSADRPLADLRVVDASDHVGAGTARLLADLGADVVRLGGVDRAGQSPLKDAVDHANKRVLDCAHPEEAAGLVRALASSADLVLLDLDLADRVDAHALQHAHPALVVLVSSPFGASGPRRAWRATESTLLALSGSLSRSGRPGGVPLLPPAGIADATAAAHGAWLAMTALTQVARGGPGQVVDLSHHEALAVGLDPAFGVQGSAAAGRSGKVRRDRPPADSYPVYPCADGHVRLCLLSRRQWRGMFEWLGEPEAFADPRFDSITERVRSAEELDALITALFADQRAADLADEAARRGVPLAQVLTLADALDADHFRAAGTIARVDLTPTLSAELPVGCVDLDGRRLGFRAPAQRIDRDDLDWSRRPAPETGDAPAGGPFEGLRVLDLGVIVFGAEVGRAFADLGADVVKVESLAFPDGLRQTRGGEEMNASFAWGQRGKRSLGLDLRCDAGRDLFVRLAAGADVVLSNFKPGTLDGLGIGHAVLREVNPGIVVLESAAFSSRGPWARRLGYGPLVRAACGISSLWRYHAEDAECWDGVTVFPDHVAAKIAALAVASVLLRRERLGAGGHLELAQSDVVLHQLAAQVAEESLAPGTVRAVGNRGTSLFRSVLPCAGDDEWCVIDVRRPAELAALEATVGRGDLGAAAARWCSTRGPHEATTELQAAGVPAAAMLRLPELLDDPQLEHRGTYTTLKHPLLDHELPAEATSAPFGRIRLEDASPAPRVGEHTRQVLLEHLGLEAAEIEGLLRDGVVHEAPDRA